jgi:hypothetical protein
MSIKTTINTPENTLNYMKYVEIENDTRYPAVTGGAGQGVFNKSAVLVQQIDPLGLDIGGQSGIDYVEKFGANLELGNNLETIWETGGLYTFLTTAGPISAVSTDATDNQAGTGAREIEILGLDENYETITELISTNATDGRNGGPVSTQNFLRLYRARVTKAGSTGTNDSVITMKSGGITVVTIGTHGTGANEEGFGQSQIGVYTIPAGKTGYLTQWTMGCSRYNEGVKAFIYVRPISGNGTTSILDNVFFVGNTIKDYKVPLPLEEKTDIEVRAYNGATGVPVNTTFNIILVDN